MGDGIVTLDTHVHPHGWQAPLHVGSMHIPAALVLVAAASSTSISRLSWRLNSQSTARSTLPWQAASAIRAWRSLKPISPSVDRLSALGSGAPGPPPAPDIIARRGCGE